MGTIANLQGFTPLMSMSHDKLVNRQPDMAPVTMEFKRSCIQHSEDMGSSQNFAGSFSFPISFT